MLDERRRDESLARVLAEVAQERARQDEKHGLDTDDRHPPSYWVGLIDRTIAKAENVALILDSGGRNRESAHAEYRQTLLRVAALAVAAMQTWDRGRDGDPLGR